MRWSSVVSKTQAYVQDTVGLIRNEAPMSVNEKRRLLLRSIMFGGGAFVAYKSLSFVAGLFESGAINEHIFENFRVVETGKALTFFDRMSGEEILVIDKE